MNEETSRPGAHGADAIVLGQRLIDKWADS